MSTDAIQRLAIVTLCAYRPLKNEIIVSDVASAGAGKALRALCLRVTRIKVGNANAGMRP